MFLQGWGVSATWRGLCLGLKSHFKGSLYLHTKQGPGKTKGRKRLREPETRLASPWCTSVKVSSGIADGEPGAKDLIVSSFPVTSGGRCGRDS